LLEVSEHSLEMTASALTSPAAVMTELHAVTINGTVTSVLRGACMVRLRNGDTARAAISGLEGARFAPVENLAGRQPHMYWLSPKIRI
jgi:hypothetical protein